MALAASVPDSSGVDRSLLLQLTALLGQGCYLERRGESHSPPAACWLSLLGNTCLLSYAIHLGEPLLIAGSLPGPVVQVRNLILGKRRTRGIEGGLPSG